MGKILLVGVIALMSMAFTMDGFSHCQVPCGIYDDEMRLKMMAEDINTIEKSMEMIVSLSEQKEKNYNQIVRWVNAKDHHADKLADTVTYYFMAQRLTPLNDDNKAEYGKYLRKLTLLHEILYLSMKTKQTTDLVFVDNLRSSLKEFNAVYSLE